MAGNRTMARGVGGVQLVGRWLDQRPELKTEGVRQGSKCANCEFGEFSVYTIHL